MNQIPSHHQQSTTISQTITSSTFPKNMQLSPLFSHFLTMISSLFFFVAISFAQQQQQCSFKAYFNVNNCGPDIKNCLKPAANPYLSPMPNDNHTFCIPDGYNGHFYLDDGKQAPHVSSISFNTRYNGTQTTILVFYQTRDDDQPFTPGHANHLPDLAPLANVGLANSLPGSPYINEQSTAASVLQTHKTHNSLYITYCP